MRIGAGFVFAGILAAQQPPISNANVVPASAAGGLEAAVRKALVGPYAKDGGPVWIGYAVPRVKGDGQSCCWNDDWRGCGLEGNRYSGPTAPAGPVLLEGPSHMTILLRAEAGKVGKIRAFTIDCPLDAGGLTVHWLTNVDPAQNLTMLTSLARQNENEKIRESALGALSQSAEPQAIPTVIQFAKEDKSPQVRKQAMRILGRSKDPRAFQFISELLTK
jgi:hypothetical protein